MPFSQGRALLIGIGSYCHAPGLDVPITAADAEAVAAVLVDPDLCAYPRDQVAVLHDSSATRAGILEALDQLALRAGADDTVFLFFCGHGDYGADGDYYLTTHDTRLQGKQIAVGSGLRQGELIQKLRAIKAKRLLLLINACHSGQVSPTLDTGRKTLSGHPLPEATASAILATGEGRIIITACREGQVSYIGAGPLTLFTQALVDGLQGKGTVSSRGYVSAFDLYTHIYFSVEEGVRTQFNQAQEPELTLLKGVGPVAVALYRGSTALGTFDRSADLPEGTATREIAPARAEARLRQILQQTGDTYNATLNGDGAIAQGPGAVAVGAHGVLVRGSNTGAINTGTQIDTGGGAHVGGSVTSGGDFVGRDKILYGDQTTVGSIRGSGNAIGHSARAAASSGIQPAELDALFALLEHSVARGASATQLETASQQVQRIKAELASPLPDQDGRLAKLIDGLADMVPGAIGAIVSAFGNPILAGVAGPVTQFVLARLQGPGDEPQ